MTRLTFSHKTLGYGASEAAVRRDGELVAVITHPCKRADFFVHCAGTFRKERFKTLKAAIGWTRTTYEKESA